MELVALLFIALLIYQVSFKKKNGKSKKSSNKVSPDNDLVEVKIETSGRNTSSTSNRVVASYDEDEDDLVTFRISYGYDDEVKSKNQAPGRWVQPGEKIKIAGYEISGGFYFFGGQLKSLDGYSTEASLVDNSQPVENADIEFEDESLGYWPKYTRLSPEARGAYLSWLSGDRNNPEAPVGYVFIYFYGIERRVLVDGAKDVVSDEEFCELFNEIQRLRNIYGTNRSFSNYSQRLLEMMSLYRPGVVSLQDSEMEARHDSILFKHRLATNVAAGEPVPADLALAWVQAYPEHSLRMPARRCAPEFSQLFKRRYVEKFGNGISVKPNKTKLRIEYYPASSSIRDITISQPDLPDPSVLKAPVKKLIAIAESCTNELDAYSRYLGKKETSRNDVGAMLLLPDELLNTDNAPVIGKFRDWADTKILEARGLVSVSEFWEHTGTPLPTRINKKESELIATLASKAGYGIAPDPRFHHAKPSPDGHLVLFPEGHGQSFEPSRSFSETGMALRLGAMVAAIDGHLDESEVNVLRGLIDHDANLSQVEKRSLHAYLQWRLHTRPNMAGIKSRLDKLGSQDKSAVSHILVNIALADGKIDPGEIKQLEKLYTALGLDKSQVSSDIHNLSSKKVSGSATQVSSVDKKSTSSTHFKLDEEVLALHESETSDVQSLLGAIFVEEDDQPQQQEHAASSNTSIDTLDSTHRTLFDQLSSEGEWPRAEVQSACEALNLMIDGAIETINDWAYDLVDAPVIEDDDAIYVDQEIVEELKSSEG